MNEVHLPQIRLAWIAGDARSMLDCASEVGVAFDTEALKQSDTWTDVLRKRMRVTSANSLDDPAHGPRPPFGVFLLSLPDSPPEAYTIRASGLTRTGNSVYMVHMMSDEVQIGPATGSLVIVGGGSLADQTILKRFIALAGGPSAPVIVIPTAQEADEPPQSFTTFQDLAASGALNLALLHTRDREVADSDAFIEPLQRTQGVWISGGRQWRLADAYLHTRTQAALRGILERGGVIGGTSAGATILGSYLVRGDTGGNELMMGNHEEGFGFLRNVAIDQHLLKRNRQFDLIDVIDAHPELLGIGIDESTAIVVRGDAFEVVGRSYVAIYDRAARLRSGARFYLLAPGDRFDLKTRTATRPAQRFEALTPLSLGAAVAP